MRMRSCRRSSASCVGHSCRAVVVASGPGGPLPPALATVSSRVPRGLRAAAAVVAPTGPCSALSASTARSATHVVMPTVGPRSRSATRKESPDLRPLGRLWDGPRTSEASPAARHRFRRSPASQRIPGRQAPPGPCSASEPAPKCASWLARASIFACRRGTSHSVYRCSRRRLPAARSCSATFQLREIWEDAALFVPPDDGGLAHGALA